MNWTHPGLAAVADLLGNRAGLSFASRPSAELGMRRAMARAGLHDPTQYAQQLTHDANAMDDLLTELTVGETYFFREPAHFRFIAREILPEIMRRRGPNHQLRAWSAGCASGEEAYSLAILFHEHGQQQAHVSATDISRSALAKARQAVFGNWSLRGDGQALARPYLTPVGKEYRLDDAIRRRVAFSHRNLALDAYPSFATGVWGIDLILCRNVLIYFDRQTILQVARRLFDTLAEGGWLITASSDPPLWDAAPFEVVTNDDGIFYRRPVAHSAFETPAMEAPIEASLAYASGSDEPEATVEASLSEDAAAATSSVRTLANLDAGAALDTCARATVRHPLCAELHYLHAVLLLDARRTDEALASLRHALYLDRSLAVVHFTLGSTLRQRGDLAGARRAYRNVRDLCAARPAQESVLLADGETAGRLAEVAGAELALLDGTGP